jgi:AmmeMemoRadiSam system protein A
MANALGKRSDYLIVASTDLSHYHPYDQANAIDRRFINILNTAKAGEFYQEASRGICEACGMMPVTATMLACDKMGVSGVKILKYANSGDTAGDKSRVVGYVSAAMYKAENSGGQRTESGEQIKEEKKETPMLNEKQKRRLLHIARESVTSFVRDGERKSFTESDPVLSGEMGAFVTLHENGELRGCIGNMVGRGPLFQTVADMAIEAATGDPRFRRLSPQELDKIDIEISVLSPLKKVPGYQDIKIPGHGVIVRRGFNSGVFLPQVATETGWGRDEFLTNLCAHKAGLKPDAWKDPATELFTFTAEVFGEKEQPE